uniref:Uncharacterized protein n=2 Tax=Rhinopithecus TaxID=542827 RepID=A0A2K6N1W9_RHIBE
MQTSSMQDNDKIPSSSILLSFSSLFLYKCLKYGFSNWILYSLSLREGALIASK